MLPVSRKSGSKVGEVRNTADPSLVTDLLMATLASIGTPVKVLQVEKRTRDDVLWNDCLHPWRRSPLWLAIRVTIQTTLMSSLPAKKATAEYKNFMVFFLTELVSRASAACLPEDLCHLTVTKIARRCYKLGTQVSRPVQNRALEVCQAIRDRQDSNWQTIQESDGDRPTTIDTWNYEQDTALSLDDSRQYLHNVLKANSTQTEASTSFVPDHRPWLGWKSSLPALNGTSPRDELIYALSDFESWITTTLPTWRLDQLAALASSNTKQVTHHCMSLARLASHYRDLALQVYKETPEQMSTMLLTIAELWYSVDVLVLELTPLFRDFSPEVRSQLFNPLLLPKKHQMVRLHEIELHIDARELNAKPGNPSIFSDPGKRSFAVQFYASSEKHQALRTQIETKASAERVQKKEEWKTKSDKHRKLEERAEPMSCEDTVDDWGDEIHSPTCKRCDIRKEAANMTINVHEWPLPSREAACRAAIVELDCPVELAAWRNLTWMLVHDLGRLKPSSTESPAANLTTYAGLRSYLKDNGSRLSLASLTKPYPSSHYSNVSFPVRSLEECYVDNALDYRLYDVSQRIWPRDQTEEQSLHRWCNTSISKGPYSTLQYAVDSAFHSQNQVIADQDSCPKILGLHRFLSFGSLRADGERVQWHNIKRELTALNLDYDDEAVCTLIAQAACQAGAPGEGTLRDAHVALEKSTFCEEMLGAIKRRLGSVDANWKCDNEILSLVILILRVHSLCSDPTIMQDTLSILSNLRTKLYQWTELISSLLYQTVEDELVSTLRKRLVKAAILCRMTFDVNIDNAQLLLSCDENLSVWIACAMHIRANIPGDPNQLPDDLQRLYLRDMKLAHALHRMIVNLVTKEQHTGLNAAISGLWSHFQPGPEWWTALALPNDRWITTNTTPSDARATQKIMYNVLEGELLVDNRPIGMLPTSYLRSEVYRRMFGAQILQVVASDMPNMLYMTSRRFNEYTVYFGKRKKTVIIRAVRASTVLEVIPHDSLLGDFPSMFVRDYAHWLDLATGVVEFRHLDAKWTSKPGNWRLSYEPNAVSVMACDDIRLVDVRSPTFIAIMRVFGPLESFQNVHVTSLGVGKLEIALPRYDLHFYLNSDGRFVCNELCRMVDPNQNLDTMIGLQNRLVLCGIGPYSSKHDRILVIPEGQPSVYRSGAHVRVNISSSGDKVRLFRYRIDHILGRLHGDHDIHGILLKAYLHAITANILPDKFTKYTGTEEALCCLRLRSLSITKPPDDQISSLLAKFAELTPHREFYPQHLRAMQKVTWHPTLSALVQHDDFLPLAQRLMKSGDAYGIFYPGVNASLDLYKGRDRSLLSKARVRNACFRNSDFGGEIDTRASDVTYNARDVSTATDQTTKAFRVASLIRDWPCKLEVSSSLDKDLRTYGTISGFGTEYKDSGNLNDLWDVKLDSSWAPLHGLCRQKTRENDTYKLMFLFAAIAYGSPVITLSTLSTILAFAFIPQLRQVKNPVGYPFFTPSKGSVFDGGLLRKVIKSHADTYSGPGKRRHPLQWHLEEEKFRKKVDEDVEKVYGHYTSQWPRKDPPGLAQTFAGHINLTAAGKEISKLFYIWNANKVHGQYLRNVEPILDEARTSCNLLDFSPEAWHLQEDVQIVHGCIRPLPSLSILLSLDAPNSKIIPGILKSVRHSQGKSSNQKLHTLISALTSSDGTPNQLQIRTQYRDDLLASFNAFCAYEEPINPVTLPFSLRQMVSDHVVRECHVRKIFESLASVLTAKGDASNLLDLGGLWPRISLRSIIPFLSTVSRTTLNKQWTKCLIRLGEAVTILQRARRLVLIGETNNVSAFYAEIENEGHQGWRTDQWPDWLLIEIESDFLIRPTQARVALEMIEPSTGRNSLVQLNMGKIDDPANFLMTDMLLGEGKSSVIVPLVAVAIADGSRVSRVITLKSLVKQMSDTLSQRLGGLVDRQMHYLPFSRKVQVDGNTVARIRAIYEDCIKHHGIFLAQPEHILSFKLMGIERLTAGLMDVAPKLMNCQHWLETNVRDILDESDELLDVKFQLIYTLGSQRMMDGQSDRWLITQAVFDLVQKHMVLLEKNFAAHIEIKYQSKASFPHLRLLTTDISEHLMVRITKDIIESHIPGLNFERYSEDVKLVVLRFIRDKDVSEEDCIIIQDTFAQRTSFMQKLLMVRGFVAYKILLFVLQSKRWSVSYGLHPSRCLSAVPYRAKGVPAPSAEFGHPDVAVSLTCLSYYYTGLTDTQIRSAFEMLQKSDDPSLEYISWTRLCDNLPQRLISWSAVNLEDDQQCCKELFPCVRYSKKLADYFMSNFVFPREGKEFDEKLASSSCDIVSTPGGHLTTGFSGTNDNRFVLPLSISQQDLPELQHTSGKVLDYTLREENLKYYQARDSKGRQLSTEGLVRYFTDLDSSIRVLIDVGAQVIDLGNRDLVKLWLDVAPEADAGVYFDEDDNIMVLTRDTRVEKLAVSSFQSRMDRCVIYLDDAHTRGTDLKMPPTARAAVTLGPRLTKDRLVQGKSPSL